MDWDEYFKDFVSVAARKSKDPSSQFGAVIVKENAIVSTGFNGMPRGVNEHPPYRHEPPVKYRYYEHAERNAIYNCARSGVQILNTTMYVRNPPCADCARAIIQSGIREVVVAYRDIDMWSLSAHPDNWRQTIPDSLDMFAEAGVRIRYLEE